MKNRHLLLHIDGTHLPISANKMVQLTARVILPLLSAALPLTIQALTTDASKVAKFVSDSVTFNYHTGATVYTGHVVMDQGSTHLTADVVTIYRDQQGDIDTAIAKGSPAHYSTLPDQQKNPVDALGNTIEYYPKKQLAIIIGHGRVTQGMNSLEGPHIIYDMAKQTVVSAPSQEGGKSVIVLQPKELPGGKSSP